MLRRAWSTAVTAAPPVQPARAAGSLWAWGKSEGGELGYGKDLPKRAGLLDARVQGKPRLVSAEPHRCVAVGRTHSAAITEDNRVLTWGLAKYGVLGNGTPDKEKCEAPLPAKLLPGDSDEHVAVACGEAHTALLTSEGICKTMGWGGSVSHGCGALGSGVLKSKLQPERIWVAGSEDVRLKAISAGAYHMLGLGFDGEAWVWGSGPGLLGNGRNGDALEPMPVSDLLDLDVHVVQVACGHNFNMALGADGVVWTWGRNDNGQLGLGGGFNLDMEKSPRPVEALQGEKIVSVAAGHNHAACVNDKGECYIWGYSAWVQPHKVTAALAQRKVRRVTCGHSFTAAVTEEGDLFMWGKHSFFVARTGVLGQGDFARVSQPALVPLPGPVTDVACGEHHVLALA